MSAPTHQRSFQIPWITLQREIRMCEKIQTENLSTRTILGKQSLLDHGHNKLYPTFITTPSQRPTTSTSIYSIARMGDHMSQPMEISTA